MDETMANGNATGNSGETSTTTERTFTQAEVDKIIDKRLKREREGMPTPEELTKFRDWQKSQETEADKIKTLTDDNGKLKKTLDELTAKNTQYEREKYLTGKGVKADDIDYYVFKISQKVSDDVTFEAAADEFLKDYKPRRARVDTGASLENGGGGMTRKQILDIKDATARQKAIAENYELFMKG
jgi:hypothetical protein